MTAATLPRVQTRPELAERNPFKRRQRARRSNSTYDALEVVEFLRALGLKRVRRDTKGEVWYSCPGPQHKHGDIHPSASMNEATTQFYCNACSDEFYAGNAATFLAAFLKVTVGEVITTREATKRLIARDFFGQKIAKPRERKTTTRASGSMSDIHERVSFALDLLNKDAGYTKVVLAIQEAFLVSKRTAERDVSSAKGLLFSGIMEVDGRMKIINRRRMNAAKLALRATHKQIAMNYQDKLNDSLSGIKQVDGKSKWDERLSALENLNRIFSEDIKKREETKRRNEENFQRRLEEWQRLRDEYWEVTSLVRVIGRTEEEMKQLVKGYCALPPKPSRPKRALSWNELNSGARKF